MVVRLISFHKGLTIIDVPSMLSDLLHSRPVTGRYTPLIGHQGKGETWLGLEETRPTQGTIFHKIIQKKEKKRAWQNKNMVVQAYGRTTVLSTTLRKVPRGTDGAVSLEGTAAGLGAALGFAALSAALGLVSLALTLVSHESKVTHLSLRTNAAKCERCCLFYPEA